MLSLATDQMVASLIARGRRSVHFSVPSIGLQAPLQFGVACALDLAALYLYLLSFLNYIIVHLGFRVPLGRL